LVRGEIFRMPGSRGARGREQRGERFAVIVQSDALMTLSTVLISPTSRSASPEIFRPVIELAGEQTVVMVEQTTAVDPSRLGDSYGRLDASELRAVDDALGLVLDLRP
jgi:mRNA interferase MazF